MKNSGRMAELVDAHDSKRESDTQYSFICFIF